MIDSPSFSVPPGFALDHVGIAVTHLDDASVPWTALGLPIIDTEVLEHEGVAVRFLDLGNSRLELIAPLHDTSPISRFLEKRGPGLHHVAFRVPNIMDSLEELKTQGAGLLNEQPRPGWRDSQVAFVHPSWAGGVLIELVQPA